MRRNDQPSRPNAMTCSRFSLLKTWLMTTEGNFPLRQLCLKPSLYGRFSLDHLWPLLRDHRGHWQQIEAGRPITVTTLLRICEVFEITMEKLVRGLDKGIYEKPGPERGPVSKRRK